MSGGPSGREGPTRWLRVRTVLLDRVVAVALLPLLGPLLAYLAWRVRRDDGPPSVIGLERVGASGVPFVMWKLRTMRVAGAGGSAGGAAITSSDDRRITPLGARFRRWRLDELPQVANVLRGDMGLLGPRPETPSLVDLDDPRWQVVLAARPGITGPTQLVAERWEAAVLDEGGHVDRYRTDVLPVKLAVDRWYVEGATPWVDVVVAWSMVQRFILGRSSTAVERLVRAQVPEVAVVPAAGVADG